MTMTVRNKPIYNRPQSSLDISTTDATVQRAVKQVLALRKLTKDTGTITTRSQNKVLQALTPEHLAVVAEVLESGGR